MEYGQILQFTAATFAVQSSQGDADCRQSSYEATKSSAASSVVSSVDIY